MVWPNVYPAVLKRRFSSFILLLLLAFLTPTFSAGQKQREDGVDYYRKWLEEDVVYIISNEEREVFQTLTTDEEKDAFIEQFWARRDPDPLTEANEFKDEHYRRLQYVNERYGSGKPGWKTDRGRFYIKFGPPDQMETHPGGQYARKSWEGGGHTSVYPFERWWYRNLEEIGSDIEVEFVDTTLSGEYKLALDADEKDALFFTPSGAILQELSGMMTRGDRVTRRYMGNPVNPDMESQHGWFKYKRLQDQIWYRIDQMVRLEKAPVLKNPKLRESVDSRVTYPLSLPFDFHHAYYRLNEGQFLVPISFKIDNRELSYRESGGGIQTAKVELYVRVTALDGRIHYEFDDEIYSHYAPEEFSKRFYQYSVYQKLLHLPPGRYKAELLVQNGDDKIGSSTMAIVLPQPSTDQNLTVSPVVLAQYLSRLLVVPEKIEPFVIGNVKVVPAFDKIFSPDAEIGVYTQAYGLQIDSATLGAALEVRYEITDQQGRAVREYEDDGGRSYSVHGDGRLVIAKKLPLLGLSAGKYQLKVQIIDQVGGKQGTATINFQVES